MYITCINAIVSRVTYSSVMKNFYASGETKIEDLPN